MGSLKVDRFGAVRYGEGKGIIKRALPVGTITVRKSQGQKCRFIKVRMDGPPRERWKEYARWWWEKNRGPVPPGKCVLHYDGRIMNDRPGNLILGTHADRVVLAHRRDPEWSKEQHKRCRAATAEHNRFAGRLNRLKHVLLDYWYPVLDSEGIILNVPFRRRLPTLRWFGMDTSGYPKNGRARKFFEKLDSPIRLVRGRDLEKGILATYLRIEPELKVGSLNTRLSPMDEERIRRLSETEVWKRAEKAAAMELRERA